MNPAIHVAAFDRFYDLATFRRPLNGCPNSIQRRTSREFGRRLVPISSYFFTSCSGAVTVGLSLSILESLWSRVKSRLLELNALGGNCARR